MCSQIYVYVKMLYKTFLLYYIGRSSPDNPDNSVSMGTNPGDIHRVSTFSNRSNVTPG